MTGDEVRTRLYAFLDDALTEDERAEVAHAVESDPVIASDLSALRRFEAHVRAELRAEAVPERLIARVRAGLGRNECRHTRPRDGKQVRRRASYPVWCAAAGATALVALTLAFVPDWSGEMIIPDRPVQTTEVALLSIPLDEMRSFIDSHRPFDITTASPEHLRTWFADKVDFAPPIAAPRQDAKLVGGRLCYFLGRRVAAYMYEVESHLISLYIMESEGLTTPVAETAELPNRRAAVHRDGRFGNVIWRSGNLIHALVSDLSDERLLSLAGEIRI